MKTEDLEGAGTSPNFRATEVILSANPFAKKLTLYGFPNESYPSKVATFNEGGLIPIPLFTHTELLFSHNLLLG